MQKLIKHNNISCQTAYFIFMSNILRIIAIKHANWNKSQNIENLTTKSSQMQSYREYMIKLCPPKLFVGMLDRQKVVIQSDPLLDPRQ